VTPKTTAKTRHLSLTIEFEPGSFRDPEGRVAYADGEVLRVMQPAALARMQRIWSSGLIGKLEERELLVPSELAPAGRFKLTKESLAELGVGDEVIVQSRVPTVTYPYEWSFEQLRDGALTTLDILETCLAENLMLKDATAYNVMQYQGRMRFIDILSFDDYVEGEPWDGYNQFCREFLYPLMLTAYKQVEFQPWLRAYFGGIDPTTLNRVLSWRDRLRKGVLKHVYLNSRLEQSFAKQDVAARSSFKALKLPKSVIAGNVSGLRRLVAGLTYGGEDSEWNDYECVNSYDQADETTKVEFIKAALQRMAPRQVVDLGCNTGKYSLLSAEFADHVVAMDFDPACINTLYRRCKAAGMTKITPVIADMLNPSPSLGWRLRERRAIVQRASGDTFLALALVHHICISGNVPIAQFIEHLAEFGPQGGIVEWVGKDDAMVQRMLRNRVDVFADYDWPHFSEALADRFDIVETKDTHGGARTLCFVRNKGA
jgi:hypothetical protein